MNRLQSQFYVSFPVVQADYTLIMLDLRFYARLLKNARFIKYLKNRPSKLVPGYESYEILQAIDEFRKSDKRSAKSDSAETLQQLHLNANPETRTFLVEPKEPNNFYLMTEKFFWHWPTTNLGSGRHALLFDMQIKGVGRNPLALRHDYSHSWGGHYLWQALKGYVVGHLFEGAAPLGILKIPYIATKTSDLKNKQIKSSAISMAIREADALRVTQVMASFDPLEKGSASLVLRDFLKKVKTPTCKSHMDNVIFHYSALFLMGIRHTAVTRENVTLEGKLIDYEDLTLDTDEETYNYFLIIHESKKGKSLYTSTIHFYLDAIVLTSIGLQKLDPSFKMTETECRKNFFKMIQALGKTIFQIDPELLSFMKLLLSRQAVYHKGLNSTDSSQSNAVEIVKTIKERQYKILLKQDMEKYESIYYSAQFPRIKFKDTFIEEYNLQALKDAEKLVERLFKMLQLESFSGDLNFNQMVQFSSECNKVLSQHSLIFPYKLVKGQIIPVQTSSKKITDALKDKFKEELGAGIISLDKYENKIVRGAILQLSNKSEYFVSLSPALLKGK